MKGQIPSLQPKAINRAILQLELLLPKLSVFPRLLIPPGMPCVLSCIPQKHTVRQEFVGKQFIKEVHPRETSKSGGSTTLKEKKPDKAVISGRVPERGNFSIIPSGSS